MAQLAEKFLLSRLSRAGFVALIAIGVLGFTLGKPVTAVAAIAGAGIVICSRTFRLNRKNAPWPRIQQVLYFAFLGLLIASLWTGPWELRHWIYGLPLLTFALLPIGIAALISLLVLAVVIVTLPLAEGEPERHQMISAFLLTLLLSALLVFLREYKARQLVPLRRTDELTQAASREYLSADLHKEIQRSEREGIDMSIIMIGLDTHLTDQAPPDKDIRSILPRIGRYLHSQLRDFDTYYRVADLQFLIILPGVPTADAIARSDTIRKGLNTLLESYSLKLTVSAGIAGLNIGDDADSLQQSAANALRRAQQQGGDRTQAYSAWSQAAPSGPASAEGTA
ncbi:GGDEF domain-containing protein [Marinobacter sp. chi1]|uniref:diguanylate cyclase n=1 Tax=Marinobacter suaedae TaxID=3057675 RepID=A0ABT8W493_9GAMM|nr:GGDEF domain-containing protein [Marinobacter sp. chi1]MDO3723063.1 GGDEF domain-containing protein [Marinobacter sp. chi1]